MLHENEFPITAELARRLINTQFPQWAAFPLRRCETSGTVSVIYRLGDTMAVRLPRTPEYASEVARLVAVADWLPAALPLPVPRPLVTGAPTAEYPSEWVVTEWIDGRPASSLSIAQSPEAAALLGRFVTTIRDASVASFRPRHYRGRPLSERDALTRDAARAVADEFAPAALERAWDRALAVGEWAEDDRAFHGDLHPGNLLERDGRLVAVLDYGATSIGDPSVDGIAGWWTFRAGAREAYRQHAGFTDDMWDRARGWALSIALIALPYYRASNPAFADMARRAIREVLDDED